MTSHPVTLAILTLYAGNVIWYLTQKHWGFSMYWTAAACITIAATWGGDWHA